MPPYAGQRYQTMVPDTRDLAERARLAIHAMTVGVASPSIPFSLCVRYSALRCVGCGRCGQSTPRRSPDPLTTAAERARNLSYSATHDVPPVSM